MNHYLSAKQQYRRIETTLEQSYELQLVADLIRDSVRRAGFTPCLNIDHLMTVDRRNGKNLTAIEASTHASLKVERMSEYFDSVISIVNSKELLITRHQRINSEHPILIADCYHAEVQNVNQVRKSAGNQLIKINQPLFFDYEAPVFVGEWIEEAFFIRFKGVDKERLLYHQNHTDELTDHIKSMSVNIINKKHTLVQILLGLENTHLLAIDAMVRSI